MNVQRCPDLVIAAGAQYSNVLGHTSLADAAGIIIYGEAVDETCVLQVSFDGTTFYNLQAGDPLADTPMPVQGDAVAYYDATMAAAIRAAKLAGNVTNEQTWNVTKQSRIC